MGSVAEDRQASFSPGLAIKVPARLATTAALAYPFNGLGAVDGVVPAAGDRILVRNQADQTQNGVWVANTGIWTRDADFDGVRDVTRGTALMVLDGSQAGSFWRLTSADPNTPGSSALTFGQILGAGIPLPVAAGQVIFGSAGNTIAQDANLFWDNVNKRLGIANGVPAQSLDVIGSGKFSTSVISPIIDSGVAGSLFLKTNNGQTGLEVMNNGTTANWIQVQPGVSGNNAAFLLATGSDSNVGMSFTAKGATGNHIFLGGASPSVQFSVNPVASSNRWIIASGSNGGNPQLDVIAGNLQIVPSVVVSGSTVFVGTTPGSGTGAALAIPYGRALQSRNSANSSDIGIAEVSTINGVTDVLNLGILGGNSNGVILQARSGAGLPTTSDISTSHWAVWKDTSGGSVKIYYNDAGSLKSVALV